MLSVENVLVSFFDQWWSNADESIFAEVHVDRANGATGNSGSWGYF
jgi:hypothetical protein